MPFWINLGVERNLIATEVAQSKIALLEDATRQLNGIIRYRRASVSSRVAEPTELYDASAAKANGPFLEDILDA